MKKLSAVFVIVLVSSLSAFLAGGGPARAAQGQEYQALAQQLKSLQDGLAAKQVELATLRHKWVVSKGRTPSPQEIADFEKKLASGDAKAEDNPYVNKSPLSSPGRWRLAYHEKLAEIEDDKAAITLLGQQIEALKLGAGQSAQP